MPTLLLTGANRGIGRKLAEFYAADGWEVLAACRDPKRYDGPGQAFGLDVTDPASITAAVDTVGDRPIDLLWNNAGVYLDKGMALDAMDWDAWEETFRINTIAPLRLAQAFRSNVASSGKKVMAFTTSKMASIALLSGGSYAYRSSKTALNMAVAVLTKDVAAQGIRTVLLHPGWVRTDMGGAGADIDADTSARGMKQVVDTLPADSSGQFLNYDGMEFPW